MIKETSSLDLEQDRSSFEDRRGSVLLLGKVKEVISVISPSLFLKPEALGDGGEVKLVKLGESGASLPVFSLDNPRVSLSGEVGGEWEIVRP